MTVRASSSTPEAATCTVCVAVCGRRTRGSSGVNSTVTVRSVAAAGGKVRSTVASPSATSISVATTRPSIRTTAVPSAPAGEVRIRNSVARPGSTEPGPISCELVAAASMTERVPESAARDCPVPDGW